MENQHCRAIMPQEAVNNCLTCIKCAEFSYSGLLWMCFITLPRGVPFVPEYKKKSQLIAWKIIPAWSTEAHCRQHLLNMQAKHNTHHWGIQWNSIVMQVKKATFQRMGSGGKGRTENRGDVSRTACTTRSISYISTIRTSRRVSGWPSERRHICSWWHCRVLFCKRDQYLVLFTPSTPLIAAEESIENATAPFLVLFQFRSLGILCHVCQTTRRHTKRR
jgi:hypothetical protein